MKKTAKASIYLLIFYVVGIGFNTLHLIDYNAPIIMDIVKAIGICFLISIFLRLIRINWDSALSTGIIFVYIASLFIMYFDTESGVVLINLIIAISLSLIFTKNLS